MRMARVIVFKFGRRQRKLMRKVSAQILSTAILLGAVISNGIAATDESGNNATAATTEDSIPPEPGTASEALPPEPDTTSDTLSPEPGTTSDAKTDATGDSNEDAARKRLEAKLKAKAARAKSVAVEEIEHRSEFWGRYFGAKFGINNSSVSGTINTPSASTLAYGVQGGYLQAGYNREVSKFIVGVGAYADWNNYTIHSNDVAYSSSAYGVDVKLGLPFDELLPYVKLGYGYSTGNKNDVLRTVSQNSRNGAVGVEYNVAPRWSLIAEFKMDKFSNRDKSITVYNRLFTFGFNYYFDKPSEIIKEAAPEIEYTIPEPILDPNAAPDAPPPP
jgi:tetrahydromethanopterin S-methyltransferase subunit F